MTMPFHLLTNNASKTQIFIGDGKDYISASNRYNFRACILPRDCSAVYIIAVGGGGGGGGGEAADLGVQAKGGGGGAAGAIKTAFFPRILLPDTIYCSAGIGGAGGLVAFSGIGSYGGTSVVSTSLTDDNDSISRILIVDGGAPGQFGSAGTCPKDYTAQTNNRYMTLSLLGQSAASSTYLAGNSGASGGSGTVGANSELLYISGGTYYNPLCTGGAGGGGVSTSNTEYAGGVPSSTAISTQNMFKSIVPAPAGAGGNHGAGGVSYLFERDMFQIPINTGGSGGSSKSGSSAIGGNGGNGGYGSGGGGGGGANGSGAVGGRGGDGGPGFIIVICM